MPASVPCRVSMIRSFAAACMAAVGAGSSVILAACVSGVPHPSIEAANLHYAAEQGHLDALDAEIRDEPGLVLTRAPDGTTLVHDAAKNGRIEVLAFLAARGAPLDAQDRLGRTPLHLAASQGRDSAVAWLLAHGAKPDMPDARGETPLVLAVLECAVPNIYGPSNSVQRLAVVAALVQAGADPRATRRGGRSLQEIAGSDSLLVALLRSAEPSGGAVVDEVEPRGGSGDSASRATPSPNASGPTREDAAEAAGAAEAGVGEGDDLGVGGDAGATRSEGGHAPGNAGRPVGEARTGLDSAEALPGPE